MGKGLFCPPIVPHALSIFLFELLFVVGSLEGASPEELVKDV